MVHAHARALKTGPGTAVIHADLRDPRAILTHPDTAALIDFTQPLAILCIAVLHFVPDPDAATALHHYLTTAPPGSYLALSHGTTDSDPERAAAGTAVYARTGSPVTLRTRDEVLAMMGGLELLTPGLVPVQEWRPDTDAPDTGARVLLGALARKPG